MTNIIIIKNTKKNSVEFHFGKKKFNCIIGLSGIRFKKREGDKITPKGIFKIEKIFYREDRIERMKTSIEKIKISQRMGWSCDSKDTKYNELIKKPHKYFHENLKRDDCCYDIILTLNYNSRKKRRYKGSAIFVHCKRAEQQYTDGCIAIEKEYLIEVIKFLSITSKVIIK